MSEWVKIIERRPPFEIPVLIVVDGVVQHITYKRDWLDYDCEDFFTPYYFDSDFELNIPLSKVSHWVSIPEPPK